MKANELRIGNKFQMIGSTMVNTVFDISDNTRRGKLNVENDNQKEMYSHLITVVENGNQYKPWEMEGIPLTEEWLLKFGFEKLTDKSTGWKRSSYSIQNGKFIISFDEGLLTVDFWIGLEIKYVHQLQNLYFALTGADLIPLQ